MKIGILIKELEKLSNWELKVFEKIINDDSFELTLLMQDGRKVNKLENHNWRKNKSLLKIKNILSILIFKTHILIEQIFFKDSISIKKDDIIKKLKAVDVIILNPKREKCFDVFTIEDAEIVKSYNLDIILRHEFDAIKGDILNSAKYGIWSLFHGHNYIDHIGPHGLKEILFHKTSVAITLQQLTSELNYGLIIDKAFFNYHWSYLKTNRMILDASISLLFKNINQLQIRKYYSPKPRVYCDLSNNDAIFKDVFKYVFVFYFIIIRKGLERMQYVLYGTRYHCWTLFIGKGDFLNSTLCELSPIELPKDEFWADPFLFKHKNDKYVFFENYSYSTKRGKISCGRIKDNKLVDITDVLNLEYHLSYPFIFKENDDIFLMPETYANNRLEIYRCISFPNKWELYSTAFEGEKVVDAFFYVDDNNQRWLFINRLESELFIYRVDSLKLNYLEPHLLNPVIINSETARNGGTIFKYKGEMYRPSQANIEGVYGRALNINKIEKLTINEYIESTILTSSPNFQKGLIAMHHLHQSDGMFIIDAAFRKI